MNRPGIVVVLLMAAIAFDAALAAAAAGTPYGWRQSPVPANETIAMRVSPPAGFERRAEPPGSFAAWLRGLPVKPTGTRVHYFDGRTKPNDVHWAVVDIDVGRRALQQCADAIMRLRAEWLRGTGRAGEVAFDYTGGGRVGYARWVAGERPREDGKRWSARAPRDESYQGFRKYLDNVFAYAGTKSLERELVSVTSGPARIGDVYIKGGFPGHAVLVADLVESAAGERRYLLLQSYMPAQDIHILLDPSAAQPTPWYALAPGTRLTTPEWTFEPRSHRRWPQ